MKLIRVLAYLVLILIFGLGIEAFSQEELSSEEETREEISPTETPQTVPEPQVPQGIALYPLREIERPLVLPDEFSELRVSLSYFEAQKYFNQDEERKSLEDSQDWRMFLAQLELGYGLTNRLEVGAGIPYYSGEALTAEGDNLGDLYGFAQFKLLENQEKNRELALNFRVSFPTGDSDLEMKLEKRHYYQENLRTGDPLLDFFIGPSARLSFKKFCLRASAEYGYRMEGKIRYGIEGLEDTSDFDPGESFSLNLEFLYQVLDKLVAGAGLDYSQQESNKLEGESLDDEWYLFQLKPEIEIQFKPEYELILQTAIPLAGKNQPEAYPFIILWRNRL